MKKIAKNLISVVVVLALVLSCVPAIQNTKVEAAANVPSNLTFTQDSETSVTITWDAVNGATSYKVYEADSRYATYTLDATVDTNSYTDESYDGGYYTVTAVVGNKETEKSTPISYEIDMFGLDAYVFEDTDNMSTVQTVMDDIYKTTEAGQFGSGRHAFLFTPGTYNNAKEDLTVNIGYYTQVAGLGISPEDTIVDAIQCKAEWMIGVKYDGGVNYNALCNFWRSVENLTTDASDTIWAISQATSMRRMNFTGSMKSVAEKDENGKWVKKEKVVGDLYLHQEGGYASGGFLADSKINGTISMGSQQQFLTRNTVAKEMQAAVWNNVVVGSASEKVENEVTTLVQMKGTERDWTQGATNTVVEKTPIVQEKPFLVVDHEGKYGKAGAYGVFVPDVRRDSVGVSWDTEEIPGEFVGIDTFYIAKPTDTADKINKELASGKHLILTPGIYDLDKPIEINKDYTIVLGLGYATLRPVKGTEAMKIGDVGPVIVAGVLFDAGPVKSKSLLTIGTAKNDVTYEDFSVALCDTFYRVGGADVAPGTAETCVIINSNNVIGDNFWIWRADHGRGVGWNKNIGDYGVIVNGDNVTAYGLMVEHFQKEQTIWNGEYGRVYMYQSELPYDITSQDVWNGKGTYGYTDYNVASHVKNHEGYGIGIYSCYQAATCFAESGLKCPDTPGVKFTNVCTYSLSGNGGIDFCINKAGYGVYASGDMCRIFSYCNGEWAADSEGKKALWSAQVNIPYAKYKYTGKAITPKVTVMYRGIKLREGVDYKVTYKNNKEVGKNAKVIVSGLGNFKESKETTFTIRPAKVNVTKTINKKAKFTVKWAKVKGATKYEVKISLSKKFKKAKKYQTVTKKTKKARLTFKKKDRKKTYYVKIRALRNRPGKKTYHAGAYSKVIKIKKK